MAQPVGIYLLCYVYLLYRVQAIKTSHFCIEVYIFVLKYIFDQFFEILNAWLVVTLGKFKEDYVVHILYNYILYIAILTSYFNIGWAINIR